MIELSNDSAAGSSREGRTARVVGGVIAGLVPAAILSYLLALGATLPGMLGLFFFLLFGLLMGAAMFRVWEPLRPLRRRTVIIGVAVVVLVAWGGAMVWEAVTFPADVAKQAVRQVRKVEGKTGRDVRARAAQAARDYLAEHYPPGGVIGYWRWAATSKSISIPITGRPNPRPIPYRSNGWVVVTRVLLCGLGISAAVYLLVAPLARALPPPDDDEALDEVKNEPDHVAEAS
jgi:hypothetical protein